MLRCNPVFLFDGNCAEAMTFHHKCLGGELTLTKLGDTPLKAQFSRHDDPGAWVGCTGLVGTHHIF
jgi:PhnB protein